MVEEELPEDLQKAAKATRPRGEASLRGHLKNDDGESSGSLAYVPKEKEKDTQLNFAINYLRGNLADQKKVEIPGEPVKSAQ